MQRRLLISLMAALIPVASFAQAPESGGQAPAGDPTAKVVCTKKEYAAGDIFYWACHSTSETPEGQGVVEAAARMAACLVNLKGPPEQTDVVLPIRFKGLTPQQVTGSVDCPFDPAAPADLPGAKAIVETGPSGDSFAKFYPAKAHDLGIGARVILECVAVKNRYQDCSVLREYPSNFGFGAAAQHVSKFFKLKSLDQAGQPIEGRRFRVPIAFILR